MALLTLRLDRGIRLGVISLTALTVALSAAGCGRQTKRQGANAEVLALAAAPWDSVVARARGTTVIWRMWRGDRSINAYVDGWLAPRLREEYGITLDAVEGQGAEIVNALVTEREAGVGRGTASLLWINGETFAQLRQEQLLAGPWAGRLPNSACVDSSSSYIGRDFERDPEGFESPWGTVQFALIFDTVRTPHPPRTVAELGKWIGAHPGRFTHDGGFTGVTFLKGVMYARAGGVAKFQGGFDERRFGEGRDSLFAWLAAHTNAFWRNGRSYPPDVAAMHRLFANGEIDFTMSNNHNEVVTKVRQGVLPPAARPLLLRDGTIANAHFVGIPFNAPNPAGAMVVADFLLSPAAQFEKQRPDVWGDGTVCARDRLPSEWQARFGAEERDPLTLSPDSLRRYARPEVAPQYHERLLAEWRRVFRRAAP